MRLLNRILAVAVGLATAAGGFVVAAEILLAGTGRSPWLIPHDAWYDSARRTQWNSAAARWLFIAFCVVGLAILTLQILKAPVRSVPLQPGRSDAGLSRRSLEGALVRSARRVDGVAGASADIAGDQARISVETNRQTGDLRPAVERAVQNRLERTGLARPPEVAVAVKERGR